MSLSFLIKIQSPEPLTNKLTLWIRF